MSAEVFLLMNSCFRLLQLLLPCCCTVWPGTSGSSHLRAIRGN